MLSRGSEFLTWLIYVRKHQLGLSSNSTFQDLQNKAENQNPESDLQCNLIYGLSNQWSPEWYSSLNDLRVVQMDLQRRFTACFTRNIGAPSRSVASQNLFLATVWVFWPYVSYSFFLSLVFVEHVLLIYGLLWVLLV